MVRFINLIDHLSTWTGKAFAWCILVLTLGVAYEVFVRYVLRAPTPWAFDISYIMYGALFMMAGAYTLSRNGHVRGDVLYRLWPPKVQAGIELFLYFIFFFPGVIALVYAGYDYASSSWSYMPFGPAGRRGEISINSPAGIPISPLKTLLPLAAFMLLLQGIAEVCRCIVCLRSGVWPERLRDVEELDVALQQHVHKDAAEVLGERAKGTHT
ncbi:MAG: TRAP transporter small permease subunit [Kiloniellales bacterium]